MYLLILCAQLGPLFAANLWFFSCVIFLESSLATGYLDGSMITYSRNKSRKDCIAATRNRIGGFTQLKSCIWNMLGPQALFSALINIYLMDYIAPVSADSTPPPSLHIGAIQVVALLVIGDFFLYWGHRVQHMSEFLWKSCHSFHHQLDSPTPVSTAYIDKIDATLQGGFPFILSAAIIRPHPFVMYAFMMLRVADNAINHSGVESTILNLLFLKYLPFRGSVSHHDGHHRFSNHTKNAKNFGEYFIIWDLIFG